MNLSLTKAKNVVKKWWRLYQIQWGSLRRLAPFSRVFGLDRGSCIDRYYIENFLAQHAGDIQGRVLELADNDYTLKFGEGKVTRSDILHLTPDNPKATIIANLESADQISSNTFDCIVCSQTLQFIYDIRAALRTLHRILKPNGILLVTFPGISQISRYDMDRWGDYWRFTSLSAQRFFEEVFPATHVQVETHGNVLAAIAFLQGISSGELRREELDFRDPDYQVLITARAVKPEKL